MVAAGGSGREAAAGSPRAPPRALRVSAEAAAGGGSGCSHVSPSAALEPPSRPRCRGPGAAGEGRRPRPAVTVSRSSL